MKNAGEHLKLNIYEEKLCKMLQNDRVSNQSIAIHKHLEILAQLMTNQYPKNPPNIIALNPDKRRNLIPNVELYKEFVLEMSTPFSISLNNTPDIIQSIHQRLRLEEGYEELLSGNITNFGIGILIFNSRKIFLVLIIARIKITELQTNTQAFIEKTQNDTMEFSSDNLLTLINNYRKILHLPLFKIDESLLNYAKEINTNKNTNLLSSTKTGLFATSTIIVGPMLPSPIGQLFLSPGFTNICTSFLQSINFFINTQDNVITITIVGVFPPSSSILGSPSSQKVSLHEKRRFYSKVHTCDFSLTNKVALPVSRTLSMDANLSDPQPRSVNPLLNLKSKPLPPDFTSSSDGDEMPLMFEDAKRGSLDDFKDDDDLNLSLNGNLSDGTSTLELNPLNFKPLNMDDMEKYRYKETSSQSDASEVKTNCEDYEKVPEQTQQNTNKNEITSSNQENLTDNRTMKLNQILSCLNEIRSKHNLPPFNFDASLSTSLNEMLEKNKGRNNEKDLKQNFRNYKNQNFNKFTSYLFKQLLNGQIAKHYVNDQESVKALTHFNNIGIGFYEDPDRDVCAILIYEGTTSNSNISVNKSESPRKSATANGFFEKRSRILFDSINTFRKQNGLNELSFPSANNEKGQKLIKQTKAYARVIGERKIIISSNAFTKELVPNLYSKADGTYVNAKGNDESTLKVIIQKITEGSKTLLLGDFDKIAIGFWFNAENSETTVSIILAKECSE